LILFQFRRAAAGSDVIQFSRRSDVLDANQLNESLINSSTARLCKTTLRTGAGGGEEFGESESGRSESSLRTFSIFALTVPCLEISRMSRALLMRLRTALRH